ncbi:MAG TPA: SIMPL domain-containing protein [Candidatus Woesebacteria bacterium]|nr:SIMPL domain-containing protein [Candidatus Woesebacteria bacterium]HPJ17458.1 SIMPL domain-containing protein [Candidatus Woesebacteria bacterium]
MDTNFKSTVLVCLTIIISLFFVSKAKFVIKDSTQNNDTISVSGDGKVTAKPDMVNFYINVEGSASTSQEALTISNQKVAQVIGVLKKYDLPDTDYKTTNLNIYTEYDYSSKIRRIIGQKASQTIFVTVKKIDDQATKATKIIDDLSAISDIDISGITFDIEDKTKLFSQARELAYNKAKQKASELAKLASVSLLKPVSISDSTYDISRTTYSNVAEFKSLAPMAGGGPATDISTGEMSVSANLNILWGIQ